MLVDFEFNMLTSYVQWNLDRWVWKRDASIFKISELTAPKKKPSVFPQFWLTKVHCHWWNHPKIMSFAKTPQARDSTNLSFFSRRNKVNRASKVWTPSGWRPRRWRYWEQSWPHTPALSNFFGVVRPWVVLDGKAMKCRSITRRFQSGIFDWTLSHTFFPNVFLPDLRFGYIPLIEQWRNDATNNGTTQTRP